MQLLDLKVDIPFNGGTVRFVEILTDGTFDGSKVETLADAQGDFFADDLIPYFEDRHLFDLVKPYLK